MSGNKKCPFGHICTQDCMWSVWLTNMGNQQTSAACALAVLAVKGSDHAVNTIPVKRHGNER